MQGLTLISPSPGVIPGADSSPSSAPQPRRSPPGLRGFLLPATFVQSRKRREAGVVKGNPMFELSMPVWEYLLRAVIVYVVLLGMIRISGKRTMGQFTPFDMLLIVLLGNAVQNALLGKDTSLIGGLLLAAVLITLNWTTGFIASRSRIAEKVIEGEPIV